MKISRPQYGLEEQLVQAIYALREKKSSDIFRDPVDPKKVPDYYQKIKNPIDLNTILKKLKAGKYKKCQQIHNDLLLIISNCNQYNMLNTILKKADQFDQCIKTVWGNFKKEIQKKGISYNQSININDDILKRIGFIQEKKNKKKITALQSVIQQQKKNILPDSPFLPPLNIQAEKQDKQQLPASFQFRSEKYLQVSKQQRKDLLQLNLDRENIVEEFEKISGKKLKKYSKIIRKKLDWFDKKIIQKCLKKKRFKKMLVPNHLNLFLDKQRIMEDLSIRKLQMYIKQITYWIEDNSTILNDYMKDKFIDHCKQVRRSIIRIIKYRKIHKPQNTLSGVLSSLPPIKEPSPSGNINNQEKQEIDNYENKMKQFKRMLQRDRASSAKRDTKIILKNQNGEMLVIDWTNQKKININDRGTTGGTGTGRGSTNKVGDTLLMNENDYNEKKRNEERRRLQIRRDQEFIEDYQKKSNVLIIGKYGVFRGCNMKRSSESKLQIDWGAVREREFQLPKQILFVTDDDDL